MTLKIVCDKCGREDLPPLRPEQSEVKIALPSKTLLIHLCAGCATRLIRWANDRDDAERAA